MKKTKGQSLFFVIIGPSGGGKGAQANLIEKDFGLLHISTGELLRKEIKNHTKIGEEASVYIKRGVWVPTRIVLSVLRPVLEKLGHRGFVIEGFPRLPKQPQFLEKFLLGNNIRLNAVFYLKVRPKVIIQRREDMIKAGRSFQPGRSDDNPAALKKRLNSSQKTIRKIIDYYKKNGLLIEVDGERSINDIHKEISSIIRNLSSKE